MGHLLIQRTYNGSSYTGKTKSEYIFKPSPGNIYFQFYFWVYRSFDIRISFPIKSSDPCLIVYAHGQSVYIIFVSFKRVLWKSWLFPWTAIKLMLFNSGRPHFPLLLQTIPRQQDQLSDNRCAAYIDHNKCHRRFRKAYSEGSPDIVAFLKWSDQRKTTWCMVATVMTTNTY